jgi:hypothetical protein
MIDSNPTLGINEVAEDKRLIKPLSEGGLGLIG